MISVLVVLENRNNLLRVINQQALLYMYLWAKNISYVQNMRNDKAGLDHCM